MRENHSTPAPCRMWPVVRCNSRGGPKSDRGQSGQHRHHRTTGSRGFRFVSEPHQHDHYRHPSTDDVGVRRHAQPGPVDRTPGPGGAAASGAPAAGEATPARRRQDAGDLVVRAGTAFEEYRQGVPGAIDTLVRLVSPLLWHTARQCGLTAAEAEDVVQQTFLSLVRSKDSVSDPLAVVRWLTVSLRRLAWRERSNSAKRSTKNQPMTTCLVPRPRSTPQC